MSELYNRRKTLMSDSLPKMQVTDSVSQMEKSRACSPVPPAPRRSVGPLLEGKKLLYTVDLESFKLEISSRLSVMESRVQSTLDASNQQKDAMTQKISEALQKMENSKAENLKNILNEAVKQSNSNVKNISDELVSHIDKINELKSRVESIESVF